MYWQVFYLAIHFGLVNAILENCNEIDEIPALQPDQEFCLFQNYSKYELAKSGYDSPKLEIKLNFTVQNAKVDQENARWNSNVLLNMEWPDHRILLQVFS